MKTENYFLKKKKKKGSVYHFSKKKVNIFHKL